MASRATEYPEFGMTVVTHDSGSIDAISWNEPMEEKEQLMEVIIRRPASMKPGEMKTVELQRRGDAYFVRTWTDMGDNPEDSEAMPLDHSVLEFTQRVSRVPPGQWQVCSSLSSDESRVIVDAAITSILKAHRP